MIQARIQPNIEICASYVRSIVGVHGEFGPQAVSRSLNSKSRNSVQSVP